LEGAGLKDAPVPIDGLSLDVVVGFGVPRGARDGPRSEPIAVDAALLAKLFEELGRHGLVQRGRHVAKGVLESHHRLLRRQRATAIGSAADARREPRRWR